MPSQPLRDENCPASAPHPGPAWGKRLLWFAGLWLAGVATVTVAGLLIKTMLRG